MENNLWYWIILKQNQIAWTIEKKDLSSFNLILQMPGENEERNYKYEEIIWRIRG